MASSRNIVSILVVCAALAVTLGQDQHGSGSSHQNGAHHSQIRIRRQVATEQENAAAENAGQENQDEKDAGEEGEIEDDAATNIEEENVTEDIEEGTAPAVTYPFWTTCDFGIQPIKSCHDCNSLLICKRVGGLVKPCGNPFRPHCNNGSCSPIPSVECA